MHKFGIVIAFISGAGIGSFATYEYIKKKYAQKVDEEIEAIRSEKPDLEIKQAKPVRKESKNPEDDKKRQEAEANRNKPNISEYAKKIKENRYRTNYNTETKSSASNICVEYIHPEEYGEIDDYDQISLTYYSDGVLTDDNDETVENPIELVGNFTTHFGEFEDDAVFVRNDDRQAYYEILRDLRRYTDVVEESHNPEE